MKDTPLKAQKATKSKRTPPEGPKGHKEPKAAARSCDGYPPEGSKSRKEQKDTPLKAQKDAKSQRIPPLKARSGKMEAEKLK